MRRNAIAVVALLLILPAFTMATDQPSFEDGQNEAVANLNAPSFSVTVNLSIPADFRATDATMMLTGMAAEGNSSAYPESITMKLNDSIIWAFQQTAFGPLGRQDKFSTGKNSVSTAFGVMGGNNSVCIRMPKDAIVQSAGMQVSGSSVPKTDELVKITGAASEDWLGTSVACAGDVNNDGYDDVVVGATGVDSGGFNVAGAANIYLGGPDMDNNADVVLNGNGAFGVSVSGAGDVNNDGYDDVLVGEYLDNTHLGGRACLFFGGQNMDSNADVIFNGKAYLDELGWPVSTAGDVNGDGYDDVIIGATYDDSTYTDAGQVYLFYGGKNMDNVEDISFPPQSSDDHVMCGSYAGDLNQDGYDDVIVSARNGQYVFYGGPNMDNSPDMVFSGIDYTSYVGAKCAGDVNGDGYDDIIVGEPINHTGHDNACNAYIFYGGPDMDNESDIVLTGAAVRDEFGVIVAGAGDVNNDGYDDVIVGADHNNSAGSHSGSAYVFFGGKNMDQTADLAFTGKDGDNFGYAASGAGDVNGDDFAEVIVGAWENSDAASYAGAAYVYSLVSGTLNGPLNSSIKIGPKTIWNVTGYFNTTALTGDFAQALNEYLNSAALSGSDNYGNAYVDVKLDVGSMKEGVITLSKLGINYGYTARVPNFASVLNAYAVNHTNEKNGNGNIQIPIDIRSKSPGRIKLSGLNFTPDNPPALVKGIGAAEMDEDSWNLTLIDLYPYFQDDIDPDSKLDFNVVSSTNSTFVTVGIRNKRYLSADAFTGDANDNWTGAVEVFVACSDHWGQKTESNQFTITIKNVNDEPIITSEPIFSAEAGVPYQYNVTAIDGDRDKLLFSLPKAPPNMTIDADTGKITWMPRARGIYDVTVALSDGALSAQQNFTVLVPNKVPRITSTPLLNATTGAPYTYIVTAEDENFDYLTYSLTSKIIGMEIGPANGRITWTPEYANDYDVVVLVSDGKASVMQEFTVKVSQGNRAPKFISVPVKMAIVGLPYEYQAKAMDEDGNNVVFSLVEPPAGMTIDAGKVIWTPAAAGNFTVKIMASDGRGGEKVQEFVVSVKDRVKPSVLISRPSVNEKVKGRVTVSGTATKGTLEIVGVQISVDGGDWADANGNYTWRYSLDTTKLKNGKHSLEARAFDGKDYSELAAVDITVDNQKAQAKGFIPGFEAGLLLLAMIVVVSVGFERRRFDRSGLR